MGHTKNKATAIDTYDVELRLTPNGPTLERDQLEDLTIEVERVLYEHACGEFFSVAVACTFEPPAVEIDFTVPAVSPSLVNRRVSELLAYIETHIKISTTLSGQRIVEAPKPRESSVVPA